MPLDGTEFLLARLHRELRDHTEKQLCDAGFSLRTHWILECITHAARPSQQDVSNALAIDRSDMVRVIDDLEERGLLTRTRDKKDRRRHTLALTASGEAAHALCRGVVDHALVTVLAPLSRKERATLQKLARKALATPAPAKAKS
nr:MarR family winged helix-turn-helix transcriptional regulator [Lolliginicoccus lacisalsi]